MTGQEFCTEYNRMRDSVWGLMQTINLTNGSDIFHITYDELRILDVRASGIFINERRTVFPLWALDNVNEYATQYVREYHKHIIDAPIELIDFDGPITLRQWCREVLKELWRKEEGFSGKRPFGNGGWKRDICDAMGRSSEEILNLLGTI
jgi:hypothetical protein